MLWNCRNAKTICSKLNEVCQVATCISISICVSNNKPSIASGEFSMKPVCNASLLLSLSLSLGVCVCLKCPFMLWHAKRKHKCVQFHCIFRNPAKLCFKVATSSAGFFCSVFFFFILCSFYFVFFLFGLHAVLVNVCCVCVCVGWKHFQLITLIEK